MRFFTILLFYSISVPLFSQEDSVQQAQLYLQQANQIYSQQKEAIEIAKELYVQAANLDPANLEANWMAGSLYLETINKDEAVKYLLRIEALKPSYRFDLPYFIGRAYHYGLDFDKALEYYERYKRKLLGNRNYRGKDRVPLEKVNRSILECSNAKDIIGKPAQYSVIPLGENINSIWPDYAPVINKDETVMIFTSRRQEDNTTANVDKDNFYFEDVFISRKSGDSWGAAKNIGPPINTEYHDANIALSADGNRLYLYKDEQMGDIYYSDYENGQWSEPKFLTDKINSSIYSENAVSETSSSDVILYTSNRPGGEGGIDIYYCIKDEKGNWYKSKSLGAVINTKYDEDSPFLAHDGKTLYFSSSGHKGYGGYDIFRSVYDSASGEWSAPENLGYPINTPDDEIFFQMTADGRRGYFASVREGGIGFTDIFMIKYHGDKDHTPAVFLTKEQEQLFKTLEAEQLAQSNKFEEHELKLMDHTHKIFFNTDQSAIKDEHQAELDSIIRLVKKHDVLNIDIAGFASSDGNPRYNLELSHKRALIVLNYLVGKGIREERIVARGYGAIDEDTTPDQQRRADVRVVMKGTHGKSP
ncbi:OmpA family protein [Fulvivirga ulvae]|uniref:OmpA family protein n=1 Tax=Fulvivirga ulvae TaxID=2904245 RepID=UPI001F1CCBCD|nr:OmpA family protein [Fulvivirga ulvae]UII30734.1 OmpA family protein [Fulvivirga ulvae]